MYKPTLLIKKFAVITLLASFTLAQYTQQLDYWECRISNAFRTANERCDCEKLVQFSGDVDNSALPVPHSHIHFNDLYDAPVRVADNDLFAASFYNLLSPAEEPCDGINAGLDRPPCNY